MNRYATPAEVLEAFEELPDAVILLLRCAAHLAVGETLFDSEVELLHDSLRRFVTGQQRWDMTESLPVAVVRVMQLVAQDCRRGKKAAHQLNIRSIVLPGTCKFQEE